MKNETENSSQKVENSAPPSLHQENDQRPEDIWNAACQAQLELIAKTFSDNGHKGYTDGDRVVFQAISETIKNHPKPVFNQAQEKTYTREEVRELIYQSFFANSCGRPAAQVHEFFLNWSKENLK